MGRRLRHGPVLVFLVLGPAFLPAGAGAAAGDLDCTFGSGGIVDVDLAGSDAAFAAALQSSGALVTVGTGGGAVRLSRFLPNGALDATFAGGGTVSHAFTGLEFAGSVAIDSLDRIVVAGRTSVSSDSEIFVARFTVDGAVDTTFGGGDGWTSFDFLPATASAGLETGTAVVVDGSDRPVVGGWADPNGLTFNPSNRDMAIARLTTAGVLDTAFGGGDGIATASSPGTLNDDDLRALKMDGSGRFVGIGSTSSPSAANSGPRNTILARWDATGALDTTFDGDGVRILDLSEGGGDDFGHDVDFDGSGRILALGQGSDDPLLARLDASGALDATFAGDGILQQSFLGGQDTVEHVLVQADDKVLVTGWPVVGSSFHFASMRFTTAGVLDTTWGSTGVVTTSIAFNERAYAALLQPDQRLVLAGGLNNDVRLVMARYLNDGDTVTETTTTITADAPDPSAVGSPVPVAVSVEAASGLLAPTGSVEVGDGSITCTATLAAGAGTTSTGSCDLTFATAGARTLTAAYQGTTTFCRSSDTEAHTVEAAPPAATTTTITADAPDPSVVGQPVQVSYAVSSAAAGTPTGTVTVTDGVDSCTGSVAAGSCSLALSTVGARTLTASYAGDGSFAPSTSAGEGHTVAQASTVTSITGDAPDPSVVGQSVAASYSVAVAPPGSGTPTGTVTVTDGVDSCTGSVAAGSCSLALSTVGARTLEATYSGDGSASASTSSGEAHTVEPAATNTTILSVTPNPAPFGSDVTVAFHVDVLPPGAGAPSGAVTISAGGAGSCSAPVGAGACTFTAAGSGAFTVVASYAGDGRFAPSEDSAAEELVVELRPPATEIPTIGTLGLLLLALLLGVAGVRFLTA